MNLKRRVLSLVIVLAMMLSIILPAYGWEQVRKSLEAEPVREQSEAAPQISVHAQAPALGQPSKAEIAAKWKQVTGSSTIFATEPSATVPYAAGSLTEEFLETGLTYLNYVRFVAGLPEVTLDTTLNEDAQHGAVVLAAIDQLTHTPSRPAGMDDTFYNRGYNATSSSNISARWGYSDLTNMLKSSVQGCMNDNNSLGNLTTAGHRRWLLNPVLGKVGFGYAESDTGWSYIVTKVFDRSGTGCSYNFISWPVAGNHPTNLFDFQNPWTVTLNPSVFQASSAADVKVTITRAADGKQWSLDGTTGEPNIDAYEYIAPYLTVNNEGYGVCSCIIFHPGSEAVESYEGVYRVKITGLYYTDGTAAELDYEVDFFDINSVGCSHSYTAVVTAPTCKAQGYTTYTCAKCGDSYVGDYTDPVDHSYEDGACIWCGTQYFLASGTCGNNLTWALDREGVLTISGTGAMYDFEYGEAPWGDHLETIQQVVIPDGATRIGQNAFREAVNLVDVCFSDTITEIGNWAFMGAEKLAVILLPPNLQVMGQQAFMNCCSLRRIELPAALTFIDGGAFSGCTALTKAVIHGDPDAPSFMMGDAPFRGCTSLEAIEVDELHFCLKSIDGVLYNVSGEELILMQYPAGKKDSVFEIPQGTVEIFQLSMEDVDALEEVIIPGGVQIISGFTLSGCDNLHTIRLLGDAPTIQDYAFNGVTATAYYPMGNETWTSDVMQNYGGEITWVAEVMAETVASGICGDNLTWVLTSDGVLTISGTGIMYDFEVSPWDEYREEIKTVRIEDGAESIGDNAFLFCENLSKVRIPDGIITIGTSAFCGTNLSEVTIPGTVKTLGASCFSSCHALTSVSIPNSVTSIGNYAFGSCSELTEVWFRWTVPEMSPNVFASNTLTAYYPAGADAWIEDVMLDYCGDVSWVPYNTTVETIVQGKCGENLTWVLTEDGRLTISGTGDMYEYEDTAPWQMYQLELTKVVVEQGASSIGARAFADCYHLNQVQIPDSVTSIGDRAFECCYALRKITIPNSVTTIGEAAFMSCIQLSSVSIPDSVESIGAMAFYGCTDPDEITINPGDTVTQSTLTAGKMGLREVYIGSGVTSIGPEAFGNCMKLNGIYVDADNTAYSSDDRGVLFDKNKIVLLQAPGAISGEYRIPDGTIVIGDWAMANCPNLTAVTIPDSVIQIGNYAFSAHSDLYFTYSTSLRKILFEGDAPSIGVRAFWDIIAVASYPEGNATWTEEVMQNYGGTITWEPYGEPEEEYYVKWYSGATSLNGTIDLVMFVILSENLVENPDTYVRFTFENRVVDVPMANAEESPLEDGTMRYRFACPLFAKQLADQAEVQVMVGETPVGEAKAYSVVQYCKNIINKNKHPEQVALCKAMMNYGAAAQILLNYNTENLANASLPDEEKVLADVDASAYKYSVTGSEPGIKARGAQLTLEADVRIRVNFTLEAGRSIEDYTFTIDGVVVQPKQDTDCWYIVSEGIPAKEMEEMHDFSVGGINVNYGVLSFVNSKLTSKKPAEVDFAKALYAYYVAAEALLG